ncbi:hypothetical protein [Absidia glauca]|uniref:PiggyBac transposable element-derived protein domain-containing protein n=1 Tax=Absidia glauca TaxID=4829 RepID=A0A168N0V5_ABSGL|nr:hypothetical protein [Absidia glauca]
MYLRRSNSPFNINVDFTDYMTMKRFDDITQLHVFVVPDGELAKADPLYQPRSFLTAFNNHVATTMRPGRSIVATVKRLTEPWHYSGRVIVADSWFGSPEMARKLMVSDFTPSCKFVKRLHWPKGMPAADTVQELGPGYGSKIFMKSTVPGEHLFVGAFRDLKVKALVSTCGTTIDGNIRRFWDPNGKEWVEVVRPKVFDEYESYKSSVDISNNRRDNMTNFHDVMRTYRWGLRCLSFCLGVTEANAFSVFKYFRVNVMATNDGLNLFTLPHINRPGTDLMSKHILLNTDVMNFIVKEIIGPNAVDEYSPQPTEWANATKSDVLYTSDNTNSFPPILIEVQYNVDDKFLHRLVQYCEEARKQYSTEPVALVFVSILDHDQRDDPIIQQLYGISKHVFEHAVTREKTTVDDLLGLCHNTQSKFQKGKEILEDLPNNNLKKRAIDCLNDGLNIIKSYKAKYISDQSSSSRASSPALLPAAPSSSLPVLSSLTDPSTSTITQTTTRTPASSSSSSSSENWTFVGDYI